MGFVVQPEDTGAYRAMADRVAAMRSASDPDREDAILRRILENTAMATVH